MRTPVRMAHYAVGSASLVVGAVDYVDCVSHLGVTTVSQGDALTHALLHTAAAYLALPRFRYKWNASTPLHLCFPSAREANMAPSFLVYTWYTLAMTSDFVRAPHDALFASTNEAFMVLTWCATGVLAYGTARTMREVHDDDISGVYSTRLANTLQVMWTMALPIMADTLKCLLVSHDASVHAHYTGIVAEYPEYTQLYVGALLSAQWLGNLACALSSAEHYGVISKARLGDVANALTLGVNAAVIAGILRIDDLAVRMIGVTWDGFMSACGQLL